MRTDDGKYSGGCLCGAVRYEIGSDPLFSGHCHCRDCQKASGAGHITAVMFPEDSVSIDGRIAEYAPKADSGSTVTRCFCPICGSSLFARNSNMQGMLVFSAGLLDDPNRVEPRIAVYAKHRNSWDFMDSALPSFPEMPPPPGD